MEVANKITVEVDAELLAKARETMGRPAAEADSTVERVQSRHLLMALVRSANSRSGLSEEEADRIAVEVVRAYRRGS